MAGLKTKKGVAKRFKLNKRGKIKYFSGGKSHLASSKKAARLRRLRRARALRGRAERKCLRRMLPYG